MLGAESVSGAEILDNRAEGSQAGAGEAIWSGKEADQ